MSSIPSAWVIMGHGIPDVCARHGEPATSWKRTRFRARTRRNAALFAPGRGRVLAAEWPFCDRCGSARVGLGTGYALAAAGLAGAAGAALLGSLPLFLGALAAAVVGAGLVARLRGGVTAGGEVSADGTEVRFASPHRDFTDRVHALRPATEKPRSPFRGG